MATVTAPNRSIIAWLFVAGGALQVVGGLVGLANVGNSGAIYVISNLAIGVAFALAMAWFSRTNTVRIAYFIAAVGWLLLALTTLLNLGVISTLAVFIAAVGCIFSGIVVFGARAFGQEASLLFLVAMILGAVNLLLSQNSNVPGLVLSVVVVAFGVLLLVSGVWMLRRR
jgi:hypothetical protein